VPMNGSFNALQDPACGSYSNAVLFYKGYQAIQVHRIAHRLWNMGQQISARALQSRVSEVCFCSALASTEAEK